MTGVVLADGVPVGKAGFHEAPARRTGTVEVGYAIDPAYRRPRPRPGRPGRAPGPGPRGAGGHAGCWRRSARGTCPPCDWCGPAGSWPSARRSTRRTASRSCTPSTSPPARRARPTPGWSCSAATPARARPRSPGRCSGSGRGTSPGSCQDLLRREVLRARDVAGATAVDLVDATARFALDRGLHVVVDGILDSWKYGAMLRCLRPRPRRPSTAYLWDVPLEETVRRHATKPVAADFGEAGAAGVVPPPPPGARTRRGGARPRGDRRRRTGPDPRRRRSLTAADVWTGVAPVRGRRVNEG